MLRSEQSTMSQDYNATINLPKTEDRKSVV